MDKEEAKFILSCFRPDGADASSEDFAEALQLAASDRELGEWLADERAQDAAFSAALARLELPEGLKDEILAGFSDEAQGMPVMDSLDGQLSGALATIAPPQGFRREILAAMELSARVGEEESKGKPFARRWWKWGAPMAAAAGIGVAFLMTQSESASRGLVAKRGAGAYVDSVPISYVEEQAISTLSSPSFALDMRDPDHGHIFEFIRSKGHACPEGEIPKGLADIPGIGCRVMELAGKPGAIVCFRKGDQTVHLLVFREADVDCLGMSRGASPELDQHGSWAVARWQNAGRVFLLLGHTKKEDLGDLF